MTEICRGGPPLNLAPLKGRARAGEKAQNEYADKPAPCYSWLFDIVRGSVYCDHEDDLVALWKKIEADPRIEIVRTKNRFNPPEFNGYRDIMMNVAVDVIRGPRRESMSRTSASSRFTLRRLRSRSRCTRATPSTSSSDRSFWETRRPLRSGWTCSALPVDDANDADELVEDVLGSDADANLLEGSLRVAQSTSGERGRRQGPWKLS